MRGDLFIGARTPRPPDNLKGRVLGAARIAAAGASVPARAPWGFTRLDLAWVAAFLVLLACNVWLTVARHRPEAITARRGVAEPAVVGRDDDRDLLAFGIRLNGDAAAPEPSVTLGQVLRDGS